MLNNKLYKCTCYVAAYNADGGFCDGCGVVCDGYIITAGHVAENAVSFEVFFGKRLYNLKIGSSSICVGFVVQAKQ